MGVVIPVGYSQVRFLFQLVGRPAPYVVTWGAMAATDFTPAPAAAAIRGCFVGTGRPYAAGSMSTNFTFLGVDVTTMTTTGPQVGSDLTSVQGTMSANTLPPNSAMLVRKNTLRGGRKGRGRVFYPPLHFLEADVDHLGNISTSILTTLQTAYNAALTAWKATDYPPVLLHEDGSTPDAVQSISLQGQLATQRRRLR